MGLGVGPAQFHAVELHHQAVADVAVVFGLVGLRVGHDAQLDHLRVGGVVEAEQVGAGFLQGGGVFAHRRGGDARQQLAGAVAQAFVQVGMDLVGDGAPLLAAGDFRLVPGEFGEHALREFLRGIVIGMGDVRDRDALGAVVLADPVGVREVDADGRGRIAVAGEADGVDHLRGNALDRGFPEARVHGGVVLEPLGVRTQGLGAARGVEVLDIDIAFPGTLAAQRVVVILDEPVDEVHGSEGILHPLDVEFVPLTKVAGAVIVDEKTQGAGLDVVLGHGAGLQELVADLLEGGGVDATHLPGQFPDDAVRSLDDLRVEAVRDGAGILRVHDAGVVLLHFVAGDAVVEVHGG